MFSKWILTVFATAAAVGLINSLCPKGQLKELLSLAGAIVVAIAFFSPLREAMQKIGTVDFRAGNRSVTQSVEDATKKNEELLKGMVNTHVAAYLQEESKKHGIDCTVTITSFTDQNGKPLFTDAEIAYAFAATQEQKERVETIAAQCGVSPDNIRHVQRKGGLS